MTNSVNPYVGPRTFEEEDGRFFFGREREARELLSLVIAEPLVLFYAQSGAGKSSLINTRLVPGLRQEKFDILPIGRVSGNLPAGVAEVDNIFVFNLLLNLDQQQTEVGRLTHTTLTDYFHSIKSEPGPMDLRDEDYYEEMGRVLIIDQFEEIVTTHMDRWQERAGFFRQLHQAIKDDPLLWVVLTLREDYVAALDPYARLLPGKLRARFYMQRMDYRAALEAIQQPAELAGRPFTPEAARTLVDNLRQIRVHGQAEPQLGQFVEPVQLQVVCYQLWENLKERPAGQITEQDLREAGDVDTALAQFYEHALQKTLQQNDVSEIDLRNWFDQQLITEAGTRGTVYQGREHTAGLPNPAVQGLVDQFLLRAEIRAGGTWYELIHDRFIEPIFQANQAWRLKQPLIQVAQGWADSGRSESHLLEGQQLAEALATNWRGLGPLVADFLEASQMAQAAKDEALRAEKEAQRQRELEQARALAEEQRKRAEEQARARKRLRWLVVGLVIIFLVAVGAAIGAFDQRQMAIEQQQAAVDAEDTAEANRVIAESDRATALAAKAVSDNALETLQKYLEARLATATPEPTSMDTVTVTAEAGSAVMPTATATPLPNETATAEAEALEAQLVALRATRTVLTDIKGKLAIPPSGGPDPDIIHLARFDGRGVDGGPPTRIDNARQPMFRPDGRGIVLQGTGGQFSGLFTTDGTGRGPELINSNQNAQWPVWSPDGSQIIFADLSQDGLLFKQSSQEAVDATDFTAIEVNNRGISGKNLLWSDDNRLVFQGCADWRGQPDECGIWVTDAETIDPGLIVPGSGRPMDAKKGLLAYMSEEDGDWDIYLVSLDGGQPQNITNNDQQDGLAAISPDGQNVAYISDEAGGWALWTITLSNNQKRKWFDIPPPWGPFDVKSWAEERMSWAE